jgi:hypothetical protein
LIKITETHTQPNWKENCVHGVYQTWQNIPFMLSFISGLLDQFDPY